MWRYFLKKQILSENIRGFAWEQGLTVRCKIAKHAFHIVLFSETLVGV